MMYLRLGTLLGGALVLLIPQTVFSATHTVTVQNFSFTPNDLVIEQGDTVIWTNTQGFHDVVADDNSFTSGEPGSDWTFQHTFNEVGENLYHCTVHSVAGRDITRFMNGRITVQAAEPDPFEINAGLNDAWFNPDTAGQGFFITVFPRRSSIFLSWFTYEVTRPDPNIPAQLGEAAHRWVTAFRPYSGDTATLEAELTTGGVFDTEIPVTQVPDGTITVKFNDCNNAVVDYDITAANVQAQCPSGELPGTIWSSASFWQKTRSIHRPVLNSALLCDGLR